MTIAIYTNIVSPHQLPLARELVKRVGAGNYRYIYTDELHTERSSMGWQDERESWIISEQKEPELTRAWLEKADVLISGHRAMSLFDRRSTAGKKTFYFSERWFKPPLGILRMFVPRYRRMAKHMVSLLNSDPNFRYLPAGVWAQRDMIRIGADPAKISLWGYFVDPCKVSEVIGKTHIRKPLRILWVGRMLKLKNVDVLLRAVACASRTINLRLTLVGDGPERRSLQRLADSLGLSASAVTFHPSVPINQVRKLMQDHDVYVFPSDGHEGWGAVVSEALEEGMLVLGSNQAGATATLLPTSHRFDCRDVKRVTTLLTLAAEGRLEHVSIGEWSAERGAERLLELCK